MCEPTNSIIQYPSNDPTGTPTEQRLGAWGKVLEWGKKVKDWLHFCKLGSGHHEAIRAVGTFSDLIPAETRYEAYWWDRTVKRDGNFNGELFDAPFALDAATMYAANVSTGSLFTLRRFLETSMRKTDNPHMYLSVFADKLLNHQGRDTFHAKLKAIGVGLYRKFIYPFGDSVDKKQLESIIKLMLGYTRKRNLLVPAWSDDAKLWVPGDTLLSVS